VASRLRSDCEASLRRLNTDYIDVYQLHVWGYDIQKSVEVRRVLEELVAEGKIRTCGWSTNRTEAVRAFAEGPHCSVVQQQLNIFDGNHELLALCDELNLTCLNRGPLGMGILTGKFTPETTFKGNDVRSQAEWFPGFKGGTVNPEWLAKLEAVREILTVLILGMAQTGKNTLYKFRSKHVILSVVFGAKNPYGLGCFSSKGCFGGPQHDVNLYRSFWKK
jgi:aryl-alcohol dehydrogenase-like predicted oxidoreductase